MKPAMLADALDSIPTDAWGPYRTEVLAMLRRAQPEAETLDLCLKMVDSWIKRGDLGGNGCDKNAERNGMILAYNLIHQLRHGDDPPEFGPHSDADHEREPQKERS